MHIFPQHETPIHQRRNKDISNSRTSTSSSVMDTTRGRQYNSILGQDAFASEVYRQSEQSKKDDQGMERERRIQHAQEVRRGRRFSVDGDIRRPVLPFCSCSFLFIIAFSLIVLRSSFALSKSFVIAHKFLYSLLLYCSLISFLHNHLFVPIKAFCCSVT